jgi:hypothetical protein
MVEIVITQTSQIQLVETSNRKKRVVRIVERGVTRVNEPNVSLVLKSAIVKILNSKQLSKWRGMGPVSRENIALFFPCLIADFIEKMLNKSVRLGEFVHYKGNNSRQKKITLL